MLKKTTVSVGLAAAASAGVLLFTGSPASAQTIPASAQTSTAYGQTTGTSSAERHWRGREDDFWGQWWEHEWGENWRHHRRHHVDHRGWTRRGHHRDWTESHSTSATTRHVVIKSTSVTKVSVGD